MTNDAIHQQGEIGREPINPYRNGVCWYGIKVPMRERGNTQRGTVMPCGLDARLYVIERNDTVHGGESSNQFHPHSGVLTLWLCLNHKDSMERDGFTCVLAPEPVKK